jgi:hypothetical protein
MSGDIAMVRAFFGASVGVLYLLFGAGGSPALAGYGPDDPCVNSELQDTQMALFEPDKYAWELFKALNHPANVWAQCPDSAKKLGDEGPVLWETWRNIRPGARRSVFRPKAAYPGAWRTVSPSKSELDRLAGVSNGPLIKNERNVGDVRNVPNNPNRMRPKNAKFGSKIIGGEEIRINRVTFMHIRDNELYNRDVLTSLAAQGAQASLDLPPGTKEVKARWARIEAADKPRYHWTIFKDRDGDEQLWGLTGLHISTKDLPNWLWTTFEHVDMQDKFVNASVDAHACPDQPVNCDAAPPELNGTKWENYRLRGTQTNFVDVRGRKTVLANAQLEAGIEERSSCITCHSEAALEKRGNQIQLSKAFTGKPRENKLQNLMLLDFMFIFSKASSPIKE